MSRLSFILFFFFFNDTATTEIYTLSLHDALPISGSRVDRRAPGHHARPPGLERIRQVHRPPANPGPRRDRKSTRLNSSHSQISYAVFCLKKKKKNKNNMHMACQHKATKPALTSYM